MKHLIQGRNNEARVGVELAIMVVDKNDAPNHWATLPTLISQRIIFIVGEIM